MSNAQFSFPFPTILNNIATPVEGIDAANKDYVDAAIADLASGNIDLTNYVEKIGDTMSGNLIVEDVSGTVDYRIELAPQSLTITSSEDSKIETTEVGLGLIDMYSVASPADLSRTTVQPGEIVLQDEAGDPAIPTSDDQVTTKKYVDDLVDNVVSGDIDLVKYVEKAGDTMTGALQHTSTAGTTTFSSSLSHAGVSHSVLFDGGSTASATFNALGIDLDSFTGNTDIRPGSISILNSFGAPAIPSLAEQVTTKKYVDDTVASEISTALTDVVLSVNGVLPVNNNVNISLVGTSTGPLADRPLPGTNPVDGAVYIVSGDPTPELDGSAYIYVESSLTWVEISPPGLASSDARYVLKSGDTMTGDLIRTNTTGSTTITTNISLSGLAHTIEIGGFTRTATFSSLGVDLIDSVTGDTDIRPGSIQIFNSSATPAIASSDAEVTTKKYVDDLVNDKIADLVNGDIDLVKYVEKAGDTMTGALNIDVAPTPASNNAATTNYVDDASALKVDKAGDTMTGNLDMAVSAVNFGVGSNVASVKTSGLRVLKTQSGYNYLTETNSQGVSVSIQESAGAGLTDLLDMDVDGIVLEKEITSNSKIDIGKAYAGQISLIADKNTGEASMPTLDEHVTTKKYVDDMISGGPDLTGNIAIGGGAPSTSTTTGAVRVNGGLGVTGNVHIGGIANISGIGNLKISGGTLGQVVATDGAGNLSFSSIIASGNSGTLSAAGSVQYNYGGNFTGDATFKWDRNENLLSIGNTPPTEPVHATNKAYVDGQDALKLSLTGGTMSGELLLSGEPTGALGAATKSYVDNVAGDKLDISGGTMTGNITMASTGNGFISASQAPTLGTHLTNKTYVDTKLSLSGGIMTGALQHTAVVGSTTRSSSLSDTGLTHSVAISGGDTLVASYNGSGADLDGPTGNTDIRAGYIELKNTDGTPRDPISNAQVTTKKYVDDAVAAVGNLSDAVLKAGDTMTGSLIHTFTTGATTFRSNLNYAGLTHSLSFGAANTVATYNALGAQLTDATQGDTDLRPGSLILTNPDGSPSLPAQNDHVTTKLYVDQRDALKLSLTGGTMTGAITLAADPSSSLQAATKQYVDTGLATKLNTSGGTATGDLIMNNANVVAALVPTLGAHLTNKSYVDSEITNAVSASRDDVVLTVNGIAPVNNNVSIAFAGTVTGPALPAGAPTPIGGQTDGIVFIISGAVDPTQDGTAYIWSDGSSSWLEISPAGQASSDARYVLNSGDVMTGDLTLSGAPTVALHAATKGYVDTRTNNYLPLSGGTMTGRLTLNGDPVQPLNATSKQYVDSQDALQLNLAGGTMTGALTLSGAPTSNLHAATKLYVDSVATNVDSKLPLAGGTMTGNITMAATGNGFIIASLAPTLGTHLTNKTYVDGQSALKLNLAGGTMSGNINMDGSRVLNMAPTPTSTGEATSKGYVDAQDALKLNLAGGTMTGNITLAATGNGFIVANLAPTLGTHLTNKTYVDGQDALKLNLAGGTMTGLLTLSGAPTTNLHAATKQYVDSAVTNSGSLTNYALKAGDTFTGNVTMSGTTFITANTAPTATGHLTNKAYVDGQDALKLSLSGGTMTGNITLAATGNGFIVANLAPTLGTHLTNKTYVDNSLAAKLNTSGGTMSGNINMDGSRVLNMAPTPTSTGEATSKGYVDTQDALKLNLTGGTLTGALTLSGAPISNLQAATKLYVDTAVTNIGSLTNYVLKAGDTMTGNITMAATGNGFIIASLAPTLGTHLTNKTYVDNSLATKLNTSGGTLSGPLTLSGAPTVALGAATKDYVDTAAATKLNISGGSMTGALTLSGAPTVALGAATKAYVDSVATNVDSKLPLAGGTMTGNITLAPTGNGFIVANLAPTLGTHLTNKTYVDTQDALKINKSGDQMVGFLTLNANPVSDLHAATKLYADSVAGNKLPLAGGTMTGNITLAATGNGFIVANLAPTLGTHLTNKTYVDGQDALKLNLAGGTMTGNITLAPTGNGFIVANLAPTLGTHLTNKTYVDGQDALKLNLAGGTMSGNITLAPTGNGFIVANLAPTLGTHLTNKNYVDGLINALPSSITALDFVYTSFNADVSINAAVANTAIAFNQLNNFGGNILVGSGVFTLRANKTYHLRAAIGGQTTGATLYYAWKNSSTNAQIGNGSVGVTTGGNPIAEAIHRDTLDVIVSLKTHAGGTGTVVAKSYNATGFSTSWATIIQLR